MAKQIEKRISKRAKRPQLVWISSCGQTAVKYIKVRANR
ncbi:hypothetical protein KIS4809_4654 [Bacillus sp. ZZV12-4809]|nr:hypothetical protein KIS4809_4654 [Bacillus sp. ZZV12-4809]